jgi:two-component system, cell cycle sensor histidine kinase and response regulator CckA
MPGIGAGRTRNNAMADEHKKKGKTALKRLLLDALKLEVLENAPAIIACHDLEHNVIWSNEAFRKATGLSRKELEGKKCYAAWGLSKICLGCPVVTAMKTGEPCEGEMTPENQDHWPDHLGSWLTSASPIRDSDGEIIGAVETAYEITGRRKSDDLLRESEARFRSMLNSLVDGVICTDTQGRVEMLNPLAETLTGWKNEEARGMPLDEVFRIVGGKTRKAVENPVSKVLREGMIIGLANSTVLIARDGTERPIADSGAPIRDEQGNVAGVVLVFRDQSRERAAQKALAKAARRYRELVHNANSAIIRWDCHGEIKFFNEYAQKFFGYKAGEAIGKHVGILVPEKQSDGADLSTLIRDIASHPECYVNNINENICRDGRRVWMAWTHRAILDDRGQVAEILAVGSDITDRKRAEEERDRLQVQSLQNQKMEAVGRLAGGVAHDFNNMLGVILGHTEMALVDADPDSRLHEALEEIRKAARQSADLTQQLLGFARQQIVAPRVLNLNDTIEDMLGMLRRLIGEDIHLSWMPGPNLWSVRIDPTQVHQVLTNICANSRDAIAGVGKVLIETQNVTFDEMDCMTHAGIVPGDYVMMVLSDDGSGMDTDVLEHIFEPFFTTKTVGKGTGLGLATAYGIIKQCDGSIEACSEPGKGATFKIYLPRCEGEVAEVRTAGPAEMPKGRGETVLLVEDEAAILNMSKSMLENLGYRVLATRRPSEALRLARAHDGEIRLLMTDVVMPGMNGREMAERLREIRPGMKCLYMSGYTANIIAHRGILAEGVEFIQKPFTMRDLAVRIRKLLDAGD